MVMQVQKEIDNREQILALAAIRSRRQSRRFRVTWPVVVRGFDQHGEAFQEFCFLKICLTGACLGLRRSLAVGATVEMDVRSPFEPQAMAALFREGHLRWTSSQAASNRHSLRFSKAGICSRSRCCAPAPDQGPELYRALNGEKTSAQGSQVIRRTTYAEPAFPVCTPLQLFEHILTFLL